MDVVSGFSLQHPHISNFVFFLSVRSVIFCIETESERCVFLSFVRVVLLCLVV